MKCEQIRVLLSPFIDGMTSEKENIIINDHLNCCSQCQKELEQLGTLCAALKNLPTPELPEQFTQDLHKRLLEENKLLFRPKQFKIPRRKGWVAAGMAGLAIAAGIFASINLPIASMIASWQGKNSQPITNKPSIAINEIIDRFTSGNKEEKPAVETPAKTNQPKVMANNINNNNDAVFRSGDDNKAGGSPDAKTEPTAVKEVNPKIADVYTTRLNVEKASESLEEVVQLAQAKGWNYNYTNSASKVQALSGPNATGLVLKVNKKDVDDVLNLLGAVGKASEPIHSSVELTKQYGELENQIKALQEQKESLQRSGEGDENQLQQIENQLQDYLQQKAALDKDLQMVTLNIHFVEEVNP